MRSIAGLSVLFCLVMAVMGCGTAPLTHASCVPVLETDHTKRALTPAEFNVVEPKLAAYFEARGIIIVSDKASADYVVTIRYVPDPANPAMGSLDVVDLSVNW